MRQNFLLLYFSRLKMLSGSALLIFLFLLVNTSAIAQQDDLHCNRYSPVVPAGTYTVSETHSTDGILGLAYWENNSECFLGLPLGCGSTNITDNVVNSNTTDFARVHLVAGVDLSAKMRVTTSGVYSGGNFAGFLIKGASALSVAVLNSITVRTFKAGSSNAVETSTTASLVAVNSAVVSGASLVGFHTTSDFDAIEIEFNGIVDLLQVYDIYYAVTRKFCNGPELVCNTPTPLRMSDGADNGFPVKISETNTKITGTCVGCSVSEVGNLIDSDPATSAKITLPVSAGAGSISVKSVGQTYPAKTFVGFDLESPTVIGVAALSGMKIETFLAGVPTVDVASNGSLVNVSTSLLTGSGRQVIGFLTTTAFDEIKLTINAVGLNLGTTQIFGVVATKFCNDAALNCNTLTRVKNPTHSVYVDGKNTLITSPVACAACAINNSQNVIDSDAGNFATMTLTAGVLNSGTFTVGNASTIYGPTSFAGFEIETNSLITATVLGTAKVELLLDGTVVQPWGSDAELILGVNSALVNGANRQIIGVVAKDGVNYNGVKLTISQAAGADLQTIKIYSAIFDKNCAGTIACNTLYNLNMPSDPPVTGEPNFPVVINSKRTGPSGVACVLCSVKDPYNVVSSSLTDFATLSNVAAVLDTTSLSVLNPIDTYPAGATAGFTIGKNQPLIDVGLLSYLKITTYNNGVEQETRSAGGLLDLTIALFGSNTQYYNVGFRTTKPFDEIKISLGSLVGLNALQNKYIQVYGSFVDTRTAAGGALLCFNTNPDNNVTSKGVSVSGNLSTNDNVATGTTYGTPVADPTQPNPSTDLPVMDGDGMGGYTFITSIPGIYSFNVPVCVPGQPSCFTESLTITVLDKDIITNPPVANDDVAIVKGNETTPVAVIVDVTANDGPGNPGGTLGDPTIPNPPAPGIGTAVVENGKIKFTPAAGVYGEVTIVYQVCETPSDPQSCTTAKLVVTVLRPEAPNTLIASDDYASASMNTTLTVSAADGVLINDSDPDGNTITAIAQSNVVIANVGTFNLATDGSYTFAPVTGYKGPASLVYQATDGTNTKTATLYILVLEGVVTNPDNNVTYKNVQVAGNVSSNDAVPADYKYGVAVANGTNPSADIPTVAQNGSYTFTTATPGIYSFLIPVCLSVQSPGCATEKLTITVLDPAIATNPPVANDDIATVKGSATTPASVLVDVTANDGPGNLGGTLGDPTIPSQPAHGTATVVGGKVQYTPTAGFYGKDIVTYQVCETPTHPAACTTAELVVTVLEPGAPNTLSAADDYASATMNITLTVSAADGVLANDYDPDGNTLTVTVQNTTVAGAGTLVLAADGSYTFTPVSGYSGPASFVYTVCDGVSGCKTATLYIMVKKVPDLSPSISFRPATIQGTTEIGAILTVYEFNGLATSGTINVYITKDPTYQLAFNSAATSVKGQTVQNVKWTFDATHPAYYLLTTNDVIGAGQSLAVGLTSTFAPGSTRGRTVISAIIADNAGNEVDNTNNADDDTLDYRP